MCGTALVGLRVARRRTPAQWTISDFAATPAERPAGDRLGAAWISPLFTPLGVASLWVREHLPDQAVETVHALLSELEGCTSAGRRRPSGPVGRTAHCGRKCAGGVASAALETTAATLLTGGVPHRRSSVPAVAADLATHIRLTLHHADELRRSDQRHRLLGRHLGSSCAPLDSRHVERGVEEEPRPVPRPCPPSPKRRAAPR
jgi:hypothetical protein